MDPVDAQPLARSRPAWLLALGADQLPEYVTVGGRPYLLQRTFKHDAWAATGLYEGGDEKIICKFGRRTSLLGLPMSWIGSYLAGHESKLMRRLSDVAGVPRDMGPVSIQGRVWRQALARKFIEGHILSAGETPNDTFFPALRDLIRQVHARGIAYVDLNKPDNILVGLDGQPYLIDFQISFAPGRHWPGDTGLVRWLLKLLQDSDWYHFHKLHRRFRPDQLTATELQRTSALPWWIRLHRKLTVPLRQGRRRLLVRLGVRRGAGRADSEAAPQSPQDHRSPPGNLDSRS